MQARLSVDVLLRHVIVLMFKVVIDWNIWQTSKTIRAGTRKAQINPDFVDSQHLKNINTKKH